VRACITTSETDINDIWEETIDIEKMLGSQSETFSSESNLSGRIGTAVDDDDDMAESTIDYIVSLALNGRTKVKIQRLEDNPVPPIWQDNTQFDDEAEDEA
jgi:hypothetical protein